MNATPGATPGGTPDGPCATPGASPARPCATPGAGASARSSSLPGVGSDAALSAGARLALAMVCGLEPLAQAEIHRALHAQLHPEPVAGQWRVKNLGPLARMLDRWPDFMGRQPDPDEELWWDGKPWPGVPVIPREVYDQHRPPGAPDSRRLVQQLGGKESGGWLMVCRAAYGLLPDGRYLGCGRPRPMHRMLDGGKRGRPLWDPDRCAQAVRRCALDIGRVPSSSDYTRYQRAKARRLNDPDRLRFGLPTVQTVQNHLGPWPRVLRAARVQPEDLIAARKAWAPGSAQAKVHVQDTVIARLAALAELGLLRAGITARHRDRLVGLGALANEQGVRGLEKLTLAQAAQLAAALGGSLPWLLGEESVPGEPCPSDLTLDGEAVKQWLTKRGLQHTGVRTKLKLTLSQWRRALTGQHDLTVGQLRRLTDQLSVSPVLITAASAGQEAGAALGDIALCCEVSAITLSSR